MFKKNIRLYFFFSHMHITMTFSKLLVLNALVTAGSNHNFSYYISSK